MKRITLKKPPDDVLITLEAGEGDKRRSYEFRLLPLTREIDERLAPISNRVSNFDEDATTRDRVVTMAEQLDVLLVPHDNTNGDVPKPSEIIDQAWLAGETTEQAVQVLVGDVVAAGRPT